MTDAEFEEEEFEEENSEIEDSQIGFFLNLLSGDYHPKDIARVALMLLERWEEQFACRDCDESVMDKQEFFLVHDELEEQVGLDSGRLCVACFEARLGRELQYFDFTKMMVNDEEMGHSDLLNKRLINGLAESLPDI